MEGITFRVDLCGLAKPSIVEITSRLTSGPCLIGWCIAADEQWRLHPAVVGRYQGVAVSTGNRSPVYAFMLFNFFSELRARGPVDFFGGVARVALETSLLMNWLADGCCYQPRLLVCVEASALFFSH